VVTKFKKEMTNLFQMSDLGELSFYLGIAVQQRDDLITLQQAASRRSCCGVRAWRTAIHEPCQWRHD
jgi:hypothetical protein